MTVNITSEVFGKKPGETYTGAMESWLLANGYASQVDYVGPGVDNTGDAGIALANDPREAANREATYFPSTPDRHTTIANDATHLTQAKLPNPEFDLDDADVDTEAPSDLVLNLSELPLDGGEVHATGTNLEGVTAVTVGVTDAPIVEAESDRENGVLVFTAPALVAGAYDVVFTDASGNATIVDGLTYA